MTMRLVDQDTPDPPSENGGGGGGFDARLIRLEERLDHLSRDVARRNDVESIKTLIAEKQVASLRWTIGTSVAVAALIVAGLKLL